jgi:hypothetical protein
MSSTVEFYCMIVTVYGSNLRINIALYRSRQAQGWLRVFSNGSMLVRASDQHSRYPTALTV